MSAVDTSFSIKVFSIPITSISHYLLVKYDLTYWNIMILSTHVFQLFLWNLF